MIASLLTVVVGRHTPVGRHPSRRRPQRRLSFVDALHSDRPAPDRADEMALYGWLVGRWDMDAVFHNDDGTTQPRPRRDPLRLGAGGPRHSGRLDPAGRLPRHHAPDLRSRHRRLAHPLERSAARSTTHARSGVPDGRDIVQEGTDDAGAAIRWSFTEITPDSFRWRGERSLDRGATWQLQAEFFARRVRGLSKVHHAGGGSMIDHVSIGVRQHCRRQSVSTTPSLEAAGLPMPQRGRELARLWTRGRGVLDQRRRAARCHRTTSQVCTFASQAPSRQKRGCSSTKLRSPRVAATTASPACAPTYGAAYYAAFVVDPDGYRIEAHCGRGEP